MPDVANALPSRLSTVTPLLLILSISKSASASWDSSAPYTLNLLFWPFCTKRAAVVTTSFQLQSLAGAATPAASHMVLL